MDGRQSGGTGGGRVPRLCRVAPAIRWPGRSCFEFTLLGTCATPECVHPLGCTCFERVHSCSWIHMLGRSTCMLLGAHASKRLALSRLISYLIPVCMRNVCLMSRPHTHAHTHTCSDAPSQCMAMSLSKMLSRRPVVQGKLTIWCNRSAVAYTAHSCRELWQAWAPTMLASTKGATHTRTGSAQTLCPNPGCSALTTEG